MARVRSTTNTFEDNRSEISNATSVKGTSTTEKKPKSPCPDIPAFDITSLPPAAIRRYKAAYKLPGSAPSSSSSSVNGIQKRSNIGTRACAGNSIQKHFDSTIPKEHEVAARFLYRVKTQDQELRVRFS